MTKLELTDEEREALLGLLEEELRDPKFPLSPEVEALRTIAEKLQHESKRKPPRE
jgi:hypothetical protein